jgi:hypothetical protein
MFLSIIFIGIIIGILFLIVFTSLGFYVYSLIRKQTALQKTSLKFLLATAFLWVLLIGVNTFLVVKFVYSSGERIVETALETQTDAPAPQVHPWVRQLFNKRQEENRLAKLENLTIFLDSINSQTRGDITIYTLELTFKNDNPLDVKLYVNDLLEDKYLVACDKDDFVYPVEIRDKQEDLILFGKTRHYFWAEVPKSVEIDHMRYIYQSITLD